MRQSKSTNIADKPVALRPAVSIDNEQLMSPPDSFHIPRNADSLLRIANARERFHESLYIFWIRRATLHPSHIDIYHGSKTYVFRISRRIPQTPQKLTVYREKFYHSTAS